MYDKKKKRWVYSKNSENGSYHGNETDFESDFIQRFENADKALSNVKNSTDNIDAVYNMETLAKEGYPDACFAMGQLFEYGWAVSKNKKEAYKWYEKAAEAGSADAIDIINSRRKKKINRIAVIAIVVILIAASAVFCFFFFPNILPASGNGNAGISVILPEGIEYQEPGNLNDHSAAIRAISEKYDTDKMKSGKEHTNRILLIYNGNKLDLSKYNVVAAIGDEEYIILQFEDADEAKRCMEYLKTLDGTVAAQYSEYIPNALSAPSTTAASKYSYPPVYHSDESGFDYYSWGAKKMNFDKYTVYLQNILPKDHHLTVAVIDSGVQPWPSTENRILDGFDYNGKYPDGKHDYNGHGTHVSGTIIDCTQGLNIDILPVAVADPNINGGGGMTTEAVIEGLKFSIDKKVDVINMSFGGPYSKGSIDDLKEYWVNKAIDNGIIACVAAGNEGTKADDVSPARVKRCITVSGIDENENLYDNTNHGSVIDVCGPAVDVLSYSHESEDMCFMTGTSMACPHISAMAAMMQLEFNESPDVISFYMTSYCKSLGSDADYYGAGLPDGSMIAE